MVIANQQRWDLKRLANAMHRHWAAAVAKLPQQRAFSGIAFLLLSAAPASQALQPDKAAAPNKPSLAIPTGAAPVTRPLKIGLQSVIAPFVMPGQQTGLLVDVLRAIFSTQHIETEFLYLPNVRLEQVLKDGSVDISTAAKPWHVNGGYFSRWPVTHFHNYAISLRRKIPEINTVQDTERWRVTAFRNAKAVLGTEYSAAMDRNANYRETDTMPSGALFLGRTDIIISQRDIFLYYLTLQMPEARAREEELAYHDVLGAGNSYWFSFRTEAQRDTFERGVAEIYANGEIDRIIERYRQDFGTTRDFFVLLDCQFRPTPATVKMCKGFVRR